MDFCDDHLSQNPDDKEIGYSNVLMMLRIMVKMMVRMMVIVMVMVINFLQAATAKI